ncbi:hypothetical protein ASB57_26380 [Bordetella sp. N]|nr:hypothetical protein ASB57_26380 [Bordetella sp. N]
MNLILCGLPALACAQGYGAFNEDTLYGTLKRDERNSFDQTVVQALQDPQVGKHFPWQAPGAAGKAPLTGDVHADAAHDQNGMPCRPLHATLHRGTTNERWTFLFCRRADGQWKAASQTRN